MLRYTDTTLNKFPFSQISYQRNLEAGDIPKKKRSLFEFDYVGSGDDGSGDVEEFDTEELDAILVEELGSNLDELSTDFHLPTWSLF